MSNSFSFTPEQFAKEFTIYNTNECPFCEYKEARIMNLCGFHRTISNLIDRMRILEDGLETITKGVTSEGAKLIAEKAIRDAHEIPI